MGIRTDLAIEQREKLGSSINIKGIKSDEVWLSDIKITRVEILDDVAAKELEKPIGKYITIEFDDIAGNDERFLSLIEKTAYELSSLTNLAKEDTVLVVGLGNIEVTPDSLGPKAIKSIIPTRHIKNKLKEIYSENKFAPVAVISPGVLGQTGISSAEIVKAITKEINPKAVIVIDALMSVKLSRLAKTIQISNSGLVPGGATNVLRAAISKEILGVPVISIGVPTVVDAATITADTIEKMLCATNKNDDKSISSIEGFSSKQTKENIKEYLSPYAKSLIVTPREIDFFINEIAKIIGFSINKSLHNDITIEDMQTLIS